MKKLGRKFWTGMVLFGLVGQIAWVVENMYLNVFIYKMFHAQPTDISLMVGASSVAATLTTILIGALSDKIGKRKIFMCGGYLVWGIAILAFGLIRMDVLTPVCGSTVAAAALGIQLVIAIDCIMTFFGSAANDAAYNAWLTDEGDESNRGKIEGINAMMPLISILIVFGGFMSFDLEQADSWTTIFIVIGMVVLAIGFAGIFLIEEHVPEGTGKDNYWESVVHSFLPSTYKENKLLFSCIQYTISKKLSFLNVRVFLFQVFFMMNLREIKYLQICCPTLSVL